MHPHRHFIADRQIDNRGKGACLLYPDLQLDGGPSAVKLDSSASIIDYGSTNHARVQLVSQSQFPVLPKTVAYKRLVSLLLCMQSTFFLAQSFCNKS